MPYFSEITIKTIILVLFLLLSNSSLLLAKDEEFVPPSKPDYKQLESIPASKIAEHTEFVEACKAMAGYYKDPTKNPKLAKTIFMAGINFSYRDFYHNFKCYTDRLGIKFLPVSLDQNIYSYFTNSNLAPTFLMPDIQGRDKVKSEASGFGGKNFNLIGCRKIEAVAGALSLGYDVVFSDVDIALLQDPLPYLFFDNVDYVHSDNNGCGNRKWKFNDTMEGNTGFYAVKSNPNTIRTWDLTYRACSQAPLYDDQTMFWLVLRTNLNPVASPLPACPKQQDAAVKSQKQNELVSCPLDACMFAASNLRGEDTYWKLKNNLKFGKKPSVMAHANWMNGKDKKKAALLRTGLWIAENRIINSNNNNNNNINNNAIQPRQKHPITFNKKIQPIVREIGTKRNLLQIGSAAGNWTCKPITSELLKIV